MDPLIDKLDATLATNYPEYHSALGPGSPTEDIDELERVFGLPLPPLYRDFLVWRGPSPDGAPLKVSGFVHNNTMMTARTIAREVVLMRDLRDADASWVTSAWWGEYYLPVLEKGNGDFICIDVRGEALLKETRWNESTRSWDHVQDWPSTVGQVIDFTHDAEFREIQAPDFASWIAAITAVFEDKRFDTHQATYSGTPYIGFDDDAEDHVKAAFGARNPGYPKWLEQQLWTD